jgi:hypothetical protein
MYRSIMVAIFLLGMYTASAAQTADKADVRSFELTPVAPPKPALKYQLLYSDRADRLSGNAALLYLDAVLMMGPDAKEKGIKALAAYESKDMATFTSLAKELDIPTVLDELELAARREECDWQPPFRERGVYTMLPHLEPLAQGITRLVKVKALQQIEDGQAEEAIRTLRLGYELSSKVGREPAMVSSLVSLAIMKQMNSALAQLMNRPESPNLYWALCSIPSRQSIFCHSMDSERSFVEPSIPNFMRLRAGEQLSADEWRGLFDQVWAILTSTPGDGRKRLDPVEHARPETLRKAREEFARSNQMSEAEVAKVDPIIVLGNFYYRQFGAVFDEQYKLRRLPYPLILPKAKEHSAAVARIQDEQPENPFQVYSFESSIRRFAEVDRQLAALTAVEALRSYAASNDGKLPMRLEDVAETPVPDNPATGEPFEYRVEGDKAVLSDTQFEPALRYTVQIRK